MYGVVYSNCPATVSTPSELNDMHRNVCGGRVVHFDTGNEEFGVKCSRVGEERPGIIFTIGPQTNTQSVASVHTLEHTRARPYTVTHIHTHTYTCTRAHLAEVGLGRGKVELAAPSRGRKLRRRVKEPERAGVTHCHDALGVTIVGPWVRVVRLVVVHEVRSATCIRRSVHLIVCALPFVRQKGAQGADERCWVRIIVEGRWPQREPLRRSRGR